MRNCSITQARNLQSSCNSKGKIMRDSSTSNVSEVCYSLKSYHVKKVEEVFQRLDTALATILMQWTIFDRLKCNNVETAVYPIAISCGEFKMNQENSSLLQNSILFPRLHKKNGWLMGLPDEKEDFDSFFVSLCQAFHSFHKAGVIHMDAYPSNIFRKEISKGNYLIKILDWDVASFLDEPLDSNIILNMNKSEYINFYCIDPLFSSSCAKREHDIWFLFIFSILTEDDLKELSIENYSSRYNDYNGNLTKILNSKFKKMLIKLKDTMNDLNTRFETFRDTLISEYPVHRE